MKKLAVAVCLVGLLAGSTLGGLALADKGGDPNYGSSTLADVEGIPGKIDSLDQNDLSILEGIGNLTDMLGNDTWGLQEIKSEVAAIEEDVAEIRAEIAGIKSDVQQILRRTTCVLDVDITNVDYDDGHWSAAFTLTNSGGYDLTNVWGKVYFGGEACSDVWVLTEDPIESLKPGETASYGVGLGSPSCGSGDTLVTVTAKATDPWGLQVGSPNCPNASASKWYYESW
jgi:hypothetical protein